jgi:hypothetical protein
VSGDNVYRTKLLARELDLIYLFISTGPENILKAIEYSLVGSVRGHRVFNLAFGNYDFDSDSILDTLLSNNGDVYKVFNTVLSSVSSFFETYPDAMILVRGSDSTEEFIRLCRSFCNSCKSRCEKSYRRIRLYRAYIEKNLSYLTGDYEFFGSFFQESDDFTLESYRVGEEYLSLFVVKK